MASNILGSFVDDYRNRALLAAFSFKDLLYRMFAVLSTTLLIIWLSVFLYVSFYYSYVPTISHSRPVHLEFSSCVDASGICSYPTANITLTQQHHLLKSGQPYNIMLDLEMPESDVNKELGMFMVHLKLNGRNGQLLTKSRRSAMLRYKSGQLHFLSTLFFSPFLLTGPMEEKQVVKVEMFSEFLENSYNPVTNIWIEIESRRLQLYSAKLRIQAEFTGLRYFMFYWPAASATIGIAINVVYLSLIFGYIWYRLVHANQVVVRVGLNSHRNYASSPVLSNNPSTSNAAAGDDAANNSGQPKGKQTMEQRKMQAKETLQRDKRRKLSTQNNLDDQQERQRSASFSQPPSPTLRIQELSSTSSSSSNSNRTTDASDE